MRFLESLRLLTCENADGIVFGSVGWLFGSMQLVQTKNKRCTELAHHHHQHNQLALDTKSINKFNFAEYKFIFLCPIKAL